MTRKTSLIAAMIAILLPPALGGCGDSPSASTPKRAVGGVAARDTGNNETPAVDPVSAPSLSTVSDTRSVSAHMGNPSVEETAQHTAEISATRVESQSDDRSSDPAGDRTTTPETEFRPPYPDRTDLFSQPRIERVSTERPDGLDDGEVLLKGFVNVDGVAALLAMNGKIRAVKSGEARDGIRVIDVSPPSVTLQRGRQRWTQSLLEMP